MDISEYGIIALIMSVKVEIYNSFEEAGSIAEEWDSFMVSINGEIQLCFTWLKILWKYCGKNNSLKIFVFREHNQIIGIVPLVKVTNGQAPFTITVIRLAGTGIDYLPVTNVMPIAVMSLNKVVPLLHQELIKWQPWDRLIFGPISGLWHEHVEKFTKIYKSLFKMGRIKTEMYHVQQYIEVPATWEEYLLIFKHKQRNKLKQIFNNYKKKGLEVISIGANAQSFSSIFESFAQMHQTYWQSKNQPGYFAEPDSYAFHYEVAAALLKENRLRLYQLKIKGEILGYWYAYKFGGTYYCFWGARNTSGSTIIFPFIKTCMYDMIKRANAEGVVRFDLMWGAPEYKKQLGGDILPVKNIYISNIFSHKLLLYRLRYRLIPKIKELIKSF